MKKMIGILMMIVSLFIMPSHVFAVDYVIEQMKIDAKLLENGDIKVSEEQTFDFKGSFNGVTRTLIPNKGADITHVKASENGSSLEIEQEDDLFKIHRSGKDETITINFTYTIVDGLYVYADVAEFYWSFFDTGNESQYEQLDVYIHPPEPTDDVIYFGYDEAEQTGDMLDDGVIHFEMNTVSSGKNGDIRVTYPATLFPKATITKDIMMRDDILAAKADLKEKRLAFQSRQSALKPTAAIILSLLTVYLIGILYYAYRKKQLTRLEADQQYVSPYFIPEEIMSLPATIHYMGKGTFQTKMLTASLLDLVRKGYVKQMDDESFTVKEKQTDDDHEHHLIQWLFYKVGHHGTFNLEDLKTYTNKSKNQSTYQKDFATWTTLVKNEVKQHKLYENQTKLRITTGLIPLILIVLTIFLAIHELYMYMVFSLIISFGLLLFALFYRPKTVKGVKITKDWSVFQDQYANMNDKEWEELVDDDQKKAFIFASGINEKQINRKNKELLAHMSNAHVSTGNAHSFMYIFVAANVNTYFSDAHQVSATSSSMTGAGTGTGAGGGGGGSGAF